MTTNQSNVQECSNSGLRYFYLPFTGEMVYNKLEYEERESRAVANCTEVTR